MASRKLTSSTPQPSLAEAAWFAGLFEGEGSITSTKGRNCWRLHVGMTDLDVIERIQQVWQAGTIHTRSMKWFENRGKSYKQQWSWAVGEGAEIYRIGQAIYPYLGKRRQAKFDEFFAYWTAYVVQESSEEVWEKSESRRRMSEARKKLWADPVWKAKQKLLIRASKHLPL